MADFPVLTLYTDSFIADTDHLTDEEVGAYLRMILVSWRTSSCDIPNDFDWIQRRFSGARDHPEVYLQLIKEFFTKRGTRLQQKRLMRERVWAEKKSSKQSARAKSRWQKENDECRGNAHTHPSGNASPTPTLIESESLTDSESLKGVMESETYSDQLPLTVGGFDQFWNCWTIPGTKRGKGTAKTKYAAVVRRGEISPEQLCRSVGVYMAWCLQSELPPSKIKHPSTWLNAGAWDDELVLDPRPTETKPQAEGVLEIGRRYLQRRSEARDRGNHAPLDEHAEEPGPTEKPGSAALAVLPDGREVPLHGTLADSGPVDRGKTMVPGSAERFRGRATNGARPCDSADREPSLALAVDPDVIDSDVGSAIGRVVSARVWPSADEATPPARKPGDGHGSA